MNRFERTLVAWLLGVTRQIERPWLLGLYGLLLSAQLVSLLIVNVSVAQVLWNVDGNGLFSEASNWDPQLVPGPTDTVIFDRGEQSSVQVDLEGNRTLSDLQVRSGEVTLDGSIITSKGSLGFADGDFQSSANATVTGDFDGSSVFELPVGSTLNVQGKFIRSGFDKFTLTGDLNLALANLGESLIQADNFQLGTGSPVTLPSLELINRPNRQRGLDIKIAGTDVTVQGNVTLRENAKLEMTNAGTSLTVNGDFVAEQGNSRIDIRSGAHFTTDTFTTIGDGRLIIRGNGTFQINDLPNSSARFGSATIVGRQVALPAASSELGGLAVSDASTTASFESLTLTNEAQLRIKNAAAVISNGPVTMSGTGRLWIHDGSTLTLGDAANSTFNVGKAWFRGGSQVVLPNLSASQNLIVKGPTTSLEVSPDGTPAATTKLTGRAFLEVTDGGSLSALGGLDKSGTGSLEVFGIGSTVAIENGFNWSGQSKGFVGAGATLQTDNATLGQSATSEIEFVIAGGTWNATNDLILGGSQGTAIVEVNNVNGISGVLQTDGQLQVYSGGRLTGTGQVATPSLVVAEQGEIAGSLQIAGNVTFANDGVYQPQVAGMEAIEQHDQLTVNGIANLSGRVDVEFDPSFSPAEDDSLVILEADSTSGRFDLLTSADIGQYPSLGMELVHGPANVSLRFVERTNSNAFIGSVADSSWTDISNWSDQVVPSAGADLSLQNNQSVDQRITVATGVDSNYFVRDIALGGNSHRMTLSVDSGASLSSVSSLAVNNLGTVEITGGQAAAGGLTVTGDAKVEISAAGGLLAGSGTDDTVLLDGTSTSPATLSVSDPGSRFTTNAKLIVGRANSATLSVTGGGLVRSKGATIATMSGANGTVSIQGADSKWQVDGDLTAGGSELSAGGTAAIALTSGGLLAVKNSLHSWGNHTITIDPISQLTIGVDQETGTDGAVLIGSQGRLSGTPQINAHLENDGRLAPGNSPGILNISGDYTQTANGVLEIEVGGFTPGPGSPNVDDGHDQVNATGTATLAGKLEIPIINSLVPDSLILPQPKIEFLTAASVVGEFDAIVSPNISADSSVVVDVEYESDKATIEFVPKKENIVFADATSSNADWFDSLNTWDDGTVAGNQAITPEEIHDITVSNLLGSAQSVTVGTQNAQVAKLTVGAAGTEALSINVGDGIEGGMGNLSSQLGVNIIENGEIALRADRLATTNVMVDGGMLSGYGVVDLSSESSTDGTLQIENGTFSPGDPNGETLGTIEITGNYTQNADGTFAVDLENDEAGGADFIEVEGDVTLAGMLKVDVSNLDPSDVAPGNRFELITAATGTGEFDQVELVDTGNLLDGYFLEPYYETTLDGSGSDEGSGGVEEATFGAGATVRISGDVTEDGMVTEEDVQFFTATLFAPPESIVDITFGNNTLESSAAFSHFDSTDDGIIDFDDIPGLVEQMQRFGGMSSAAARASIRLSIQRAIDRANVPEPTTVVMSLIGLLAACWQRPRRS